MNKKVVLLAEVLVNGKGCPVCGGNKTEKTKTCRDCFEKIGHDATKAVKRVIESSEKARAGHEAAVASADDVSREILQGAILAQFKLSNRAKHVPANGKIKSYFHIGMEIQNGFCNVSVFGASEQDRGTVITGLVEVKRRKNDEFSVPYVRIQKVDPPIVSTVFLSIKNIGAKDMLRVTLPLTHIMGQIKKGSMPKIIRGSVGYVLDKQVVGKQIEEAMEVASQ